MSLFPVGLHLFPNKGGFDYDLTVNDGSSIVSDDGFKTPGDAFNDAYQQIMESLETGELTADADRFIEGGQINAWRHLEMNFTISLEKKGNN